MWPHLLSGPAFMYTWTEHLIYAVLRPFFTPLYATFLHSTMNTTDNVVLSPMSYLSPIVQGFASHHSWVMISMSSFSASNSSRIVFRPLAPCPMSYLRGTAWIINDSQDSFSSTSMTPVLTVLAAVEIFSPNCRAISAVAF